MNDSKVSIIVPVYKTEQYLLRCVNSIVNQSYKNIEIILVDDGSPDKCSVMCDQLAEQYSHIKVIHKINGGLSSARNAGLELASGYFISFVDSDDFIDKDMIKRMVELSCKYNADVVMLSYRETKSNFMIDNIKNENEKIFFESCIPRAFLSLKVDSVCICMYKFSAIGKTRFIEGKTSEDIPFNFEIFNKIRVFIYVPEKRYYYFYNNTSISNGILDKNMLNYLEFRKDILDFYVVQGDSSLIQSAEALYVRAAMGLQARMALYGLDCDLNEKSLKDNFTSIFEKYKRSFFYESTIPLTRKILALIVFYFYDLVRIVRKIYGEDTR